MDVRLASLCGALMGMPARGIVSRALKGLFCNDEVSVRAVGVTGAAVDVACHAAPLEALLSRELLTLLQIRPGVR